MRRRAGFTLIELLVVQLAQVDAEIQGLLTVTRPTSSCAPLAHVALRHSANFFGVAVPYSSQYHSVPSQPRRNGLICSFFVRFLFG